jgi:hypothetical protein
MVACATWPSCFCICWRRSRDSPGPAARVPWSPNRCSSNTNCGYSIKNSTVRTAHDPPARPTGTALAGALQHRRFVRQNATNPGMSPENLRQAAGRSRHPRPSRCPSVQNRMRRRSLAPIVSKSRSSHRRRRSPLQDWSAGSRMPHCPTASVSMRECEARQTQRSEDGARRSAAALRRTVCVAVPRGHRVQRPERSCRGDRVARNAGLRRMPWRTRGWIARSATASYS